MEAEGPRDMGMAARAITQRSPPTLPPGGVMGLTPAGGGVTSTPFFTELIEPTAGFPVPSEQPGTAIAVKAKAKPARRLVRKRSWCRHLMGIRLHQTRGDRLEMPIADGRALRSIFPKVFRPGVMAVGGDSGGSISENHFFGGRKSHLSRTQLLHE